MVATSQPQGDGAFGDGWTYFDEAQFQQSLNEGYEKIGQINVAILGKTGVGKSTLINAVFGIDAAETGVGKPVTPDSCIYLCETGFLGLIDSRGIEIADGDDRIIKNFREVNEKHSVHIVWYCVNAAGGRFEPAEERLVEAISRLGVPVIVVLTKVQRRSGENHPDAELLAEHIRGLGMKVAKGSPVLLCAHPVHSRGEEAHGLETLVNCTADVIPDAVQTAFDAAQQVDLRRKRTRCMGIVTAASAAASAAAISPVPATDAAGTLVIQAGMMAGVGAVYGIGMTWSSIASTVSVTIARQLGRLAFGSLLKAFPGIGTAVGATVNAAIAGAFTLSMGMAWMAVCERMAKGELSSQDSRAVKRVFLAELKDQLKKEKRSKGINELHPDNIDPKSET